MQDKSPPIRDPRLRRSLGYALVRVFRQVNRASNRTLRRHGLSAEQAHILLVLWLEGPMKIGTMQRILMLSSGTLTGAVDRMEKAGLVRRTPDPDDRRAWRLEPGVADARARSEIEGTLESVEEECFHALSAAERRQFLGLLEKISLSLGD